jgi:ribulose-bisphosphate carboxylase small chain
MKLTQGAFSFLPDLTDAQISKQIQYAIDKSWAVSIEYTDDPHPRNNYWEMWGLPLFDIKDPAAVLFEINMAKKAKPNYYVKVAAFDNSRGTESCVLSYIVQRPAYEPGFKLVRQEAEGRRLVYTLTSYSLSVVKRSSSGTDRPQGVSPVSCAVLLLKDERDCRVRPKWPPPPPSSSWTRPLRRPRRRPTSTHSKRATLTATWWTWARNTRATCASSSTWRPSEARRP